MSRCIVEDCKSNDPIKGCMVSYNHEMFEPIACEYGRFVTFVTERFGHLGKWKFKRISSYSGALIATLSGKHGRVEIWGGTNHRNEVWVIPNRAGGCLMGTLLNLETIEIACNRAGIQMALDLGGGNA